MLADEDWRAESYFGGGRRFGESIGEVSPYRLIDRLIYIFHYLRIKTNLILFIVRFLKQIYLSNEDLQHNSLPC